MVVVAAPTLCNWNEKRHDTMTEISEEYGIDFIDMQFGDDVVDIDWSCESYDGGDHLNYTGALKTSAKMADILVNRYGLEDHRGDEKYRSFDDALPGYLEVIENKKATKLD